MSTYEKNVEEIRTENLQLREALNAICKHLGDLSDVSLVPASVDVSPSDVETRVKRLVEGYRSLQTEHEEVVARYTADYRKWRRFKQWLLAGVVDKETSSRSPLTDKVGKENVASDVAERDADVAIRSRVPTATSSVQDYELSSEALGKRRALGDPSSPTPKRKARLEGGPAVDEENNEAKKETVIKSVQRRGRYAQYDTTSETAAISSSKGEELSFKYEEVVRNKQERRRLHGSDCECCRDYYEAIGPLPPRLQAPLWRTPPSSPAKVGSSYHDKGSSEDEHEREAEIQGHKQQISRHRARWEAPKTPPGYWNIGFPDTQEIEAIRKAAAEMREKEAKRARRESEAKPGGSKRK